ncbi:alanine racemase [Novosphingobium sp. MW5]|nr:alanine racemase [Novosphingobium sp. MW5]
MTPEPPLRLALDEEALVHNWRTLDRLSGSARAGAAVKANAYGVGARRVTKALARAGCRDFFVAYSGEAAELDGLVDPSSISILHGPQDANDASFIAARGYRPVINSPHQAALWLDASSARCDVMVDTGINRIGFSMDDLADPTIGRLDVQTVLSHLACADEDSPMNDCQRALWTDAVLHIGKCESSLANSAGIMLGSSYHGHLTRPGLALYGGIPRAELAGEIRQVVRPQAAIMQVRDLQAGDTVGYNATYTAAGPLRVAVVALGYADGYLRCWSGNGMLRSNGRELPVLGRVSMDMTVIDLTAAPELREGDWVEADYSLPEASQASGLSQYELLTLLGRRFTR